MSLVFFRVDIRSTTESSLTAIAESCNGVIDRADLTEDLNGGEPEVHIGLADFKDETEGYKLLLDFYITDHEKRDEYYNLILQSVENVSRQDLTKIVCSENQDCTQNADRPQPDIMTEFYEWAI